MKTYTLVLDQLPDEVHLLDLGTHRRKDLHRPEHIHQPFMLQSQTHRFCYCHEQKATDILPPWQFVEIYLVSQGHYGHHTRYHK